MYYKHDLNYQYPSRSDEHMITVKQVKSIAFDEAYAYRNKGFFFKLMRVIYWLALNAIVFPVCRVSHGLRIHGRENLKKHKKALKNGAITVSNHVFYWDYLCVLKAIRPHLAYFPAWKTNVTGPMGGFIRLSGGIPVPVGNTRAMRCFRNAMDEVVEDGKWLHFFPEGSMWLFYPGIRPLKKAAFQYAVRYDKPLIPISMSFRPRKGILRLFGKKPLVDLHIGEPLYPDHTLSVREATEKMRGEAYHVMQVMNGITPDDPIYQTEQSIRDYQKIM